MSISVKAFLSFLFLTLGLQGPAMAATNCLGIQQNDGISAALMLEQSGEFSLKYAALDGTRRVCTFILDENYRPRTVNPKKDRYIIDEASSVNCDAEFIWVGKNLMDAGRGYVDVKFACQSGGGCAHAEMGEVESFVCSSQPFAGR